MFKNIFKLIYLTKKMKSKNNKNKINSIELLAPAGNLEKMETGLAYGADAIYFGIPDFSLRVRINDFDLKSLKKGIEYTHKLNKKAYITINIFAHNEHIKKLKKYIQRLKDLKPDALIVSDPGVIEIIKSEWKNAVIHLSTQANCTNVSSARFWAKQGIERVILGREVTLKEIKEIHKELPNLELEYFVHGAMCMAYSGRCFLSKLFVDRSANLGDCSQPCRWEFDVNRYHLKAERHEEELELVEERHGSYILNSKDLCLIEYLDQLVKAGITSFKIEGRAKSSYYLATIIAIYRQALDNILSKDFKKIAKKLLKELTEKLVHRGYTSGFLLGDKADQNIENSRQSSNWEYCGQIKRIEDSNKELKVYFKVHNTIKVGDKIEIIGLNYDIIKLELKEMFLSENNESISEAHGGGGAKIVYIKLNKKYLNTIFPLAVIRRYKK